MGSYYRITYLGDSLADIRQSIDSLLDAYNRELSAWVPDSKLSQFNKGDTGVDLTGTLHFLPNLELARTINTQTGGAYDPTVAPLVQYWGFGGGTKRTNTNYDQADIDRLLPLVGMENISVENNYLRKSAPGVQLDI